MGNLYGKALIIDNNVKFVEGIKEEVKLLNDYPCFIAKTFIEASQILKQRRHNIRVIFLSTSIGPSHGVDELKKIKTDLPLIPVILITHQPQKDPKEIMEPDSGIVKILQNPKNYHSLTKEIDSLFRSKELWTDIQVSKEEKNIEISLVEEGYVPTLLSSFVLTPKSYFNIYVRIGQSKFIKILNVGDPLDIELIQTYEKKGSTHLYISQDEHRKYIRFCEEMSKKTLNRQDVSSVVKMNDVLNFGSNIAQSLLHTGISQEKLDFANTFLSQSVHLIKNMRMKNESLKKFLDSIEKNEHSTAVSFLSGMIANEAGIETMKAIKIVGIAALLHDIGLYDLDPDFKEHDLENLNEKQKTIFDQHQKHGGEILRNCGGFDEIIYQSVETHHMRPRGSDSFRRKNTINMVAEIIGAADELYNMVTSNHADKEHIRLFTEINLKNFSPQVEKAVLKLLNKKPAK